MRIRESWGSLRGCGDNGWGAQVMSVLSVLTRFILQVIYASGCYILCTSSHLHCLNSSGLVSVIVLSDTSICGKVSATYVFRTIVAHFRIFQ